jgi:hypothetical protein
VIPRLDRWQLRWADQRLGLIVFAGLLSVGGYLQAPNPDEVAHLPSGMSHWRFERFELYRVNPPLVRMMAAVPLLGADSNMDWKVWVDGSPYARAEFSVGRQFIRSNGEHSFWYFTLARWACIPLLLWGGWVCFLWSRELFGTAGGLVSLTLYCFCPNMLAWGATITPDAGAAALGLVAGYAFWCWLKKPDWGTAFFAALALGLAELTKTTWIVLFALWPLVWAVWRWQFRAATKIGSRGVPAASHGSGPDDSNAESTHPNAGGIEPENAVTIASPADDAPIVANIPDRKSAPPPLKQLAFILCFGVYLINLGYGFEDSLTPLGEFRFISHTLSGEETPREGANRFEDSWLGSIPVPLPKNYVLGIDVQRRDFEQGKWSYLRGETKKGGWWYYYLYALLVKTPIGTLVILAVAAWLLCKRERRGVRDVVRGEGQGLRDEGQKQEDKVLSSSHATRPSALAPHPSKVLSSSHAPGPSAPGPSAPGPSALAPRPSRWLDYLVVLAPAVAVLVLVSSQTGFNRYLRYVLPAVPFLYVMAGRVGMVLSRQRPVISSVILLALAASVIESLSVFPHSMSFFNRFVGGPLGGHRHLLDANVDWGQDLLFLKDWYDEHPEARPLHVAYFNDFMVDPRIAGIEWEPVPQFDPAEAGDYVGAGQGPQPGWYAISANHLFGYRHFEHSRPVYTWLQQFEPVGMAGYSIYIFHVTSDQADRLRQKLGLSPL